MNKELKRVSTVVLLMFIALFCSSTVIQAVSTDQLKNDSRNARTRYDGYSVERGSILVGGNAIAQSKPSKDVYRFQRVYTDPKLYANITGYYTLNQANTGIEGALNDYLSGTSDAQFLDNLTRTVTGKTPKGASVELTIVKKVQKAAYDALGNQRGAVVALDPKTGAILAMVSKPSFDPNALAVHDNAKFFQAYNSLLNNQNKPLTNRAVAGDLYHPGSVFKPLVAAAALDSGKFTADSTFPNPAQLKLPLTSGTYIHNAGGGTCGPGATATIATAVRLSCNIPMAQLGEKLGTSTLADYTSRFGFGKKLSLAEGRFDVSPSSYPANADTPGLMMSAFGQGEDRVTPLQIAMDSAAIGNRGILMQPTLVNRIIAPDLTELKALQPSVYNTPISEETASKVRDMMVSSVANGAASNATIEGVEVAGKTGTAQNGVGEPYTLWFTGFAPAKDPQVAVAVVVENGGGLGESSFGNAIAAPIAKKVLEAVLNK